MLKILNCLIPILGAGLIAYAISGGDQTQKFPNLPQPQNQNTDLWQVARVSYGDTITVNRADEECQIRFCGIDAPETAHRSSEISQPVGDAANSLKMRSPVTTMRLGLNS